MNTNKFSSLIRRFNRSDSVFVISGWPETSGRSENNYGIAWYTKETVEPIARKYGQKFVVLGETNHDNAPRTFAKGNVLVLRVFDQRHPSLFPRILKWLRVFRNIDRVFVHSEFCTNGGIKNFVLLIPFLMLIKLSGKRITYFAHNVVTDLTGIAPHLNLDKRSLWFRILNAGIRVYYFLLGSLTDRLVVMDDEMKRRLTAFVEPHKVLSVPFWIKPRKLPYTKTAARKALGISQRAQVIISFGFVTWYKGADWLIDQARSRRFRRANPDTHVIMAGGEAWSLKDKPYYQRYYAAQAAKTRRASSVRITGFVPEHDIGLYFAAADAAVFPYRGLIGSSGAITYALSYGKPVLISAKMKNALMNPSYQGGLAHAGLLPQDMVFSHKGDSFTASVRRLRDARFSEKLAKCTAFIRDQRSFATQLPLYHELLFCTERQTAVRLGKAPVHADIHTLPAYHTAS